VAERWTTEREGLIARGATRPMLLKSVTRMVEAEARPSLSQPSARGRDFGSLVHHIMESIPLDQPEQARPMAKALAPKYGLDEDAAERAAAAVEGALALPALDRARRSPRVMREVPFWLPDTETLIEGKVDLVFEEDGELVLIDYKTEQVTAAQAIDQAGRHSKQLHLYHRGLNQGAGMRVKERLVLFTSIPQTVQV
jgi:ATP-dependent exoDNAse (exonuclease V) beta subunit